MESVGFQLPLFLFCLIGICSYADGIPEFQNKTSTEKQLIQDILQDYDNITRPRINSSEAVNVEIKLTLILLRELNEQEQLMQTYIWITMEWRDDYLQWNPKYYENLTSIILPQSKVWLPDVAIQNSAGGIYGDLFDSKIRMKVEHDGTVFFSPSGQLITTCNLNLKFFPFDTQICIIELANWVYGGEQVTLSNKTAEIDMSRFELNGQWEIIETSMNCSAYDFSEEIFPTVRGILVLKRKPLYYLIYVMLPCILLSGLSLLVFWIPPDAGERISLGITVLLSFSVFQLVILEKLPESSDYIPILGVYISLVMVTTSVSLILASVVVNIQRKSMSDEPVPEWIKMLTSHVARIGCMQKPHGKNYTKKHLPYAIITLTSNLSAIWGTEANSPVKPPETIKPPEGLQGTEEDSSTTPHSDFCEDSMSHGEQWKYTGRVLDRFFFVLIGLVDLLICLVCMVIIPLTSSNTYLSKH